jgi:AraC family transcriptional regulator
MPSHLHITQSAPLILAGVNQRYKVGPNAGMKLQWAKLMEDFGQIAGQVGTKAFGVCHDFGNGEMDYLAAAQVSDGGQVPGYLHVLHIPARKVAVIGHDGPLEKISETWAKIFETYLPSAKLEVAAGPQFEVYDGDLIEIHIPVK